MREKITNILKRGELYWLDITINGERIRKSTGKSTINEALIFKEEFINNYNNNDNNNNDNDNNNYKQIIIDGYTFDMIALKFIEDKTRSCKEKTVQTYKLFVKKLFQFFTERQLKDINKLMIKEYENFRLLNGCSEQILRKELIVLNIILNIAVEYEMLDKNPLTTYKFRKQFKDYEPRERFLNPIECQLIIKNANEYLRRIIIFLLETGLRINELTHLLYTDLGTDIKTNIQYIKIRKEISKSNRERYIPLTNLAMEQVNKQKIEFINSLYIFTNSKGQYYKTTPKKALYTTFRNAKVKQAGFHIFRHTFASLRLQGLNTNGEKITPLRMEILTKLLGHSNTQITEKHYAKFSQQDILLSLNE